MRQDKCSGSRPDFHFWGIVVLSLMCGPHIFDRTSTFSHPHSQTGHSQTGHGSIFNCPVYTLICTGHSITFTSCLHCHSDRTRPVYDLSAQCVNQGPVYAPAHTGHLKIDTSCLRVYPNRTVLSTHPYKQDAANGRWVGGSVLSIHITRVLRRRGHNAAFTQGNMYCMVLWLYIYMYGPRSVPQKGNFVKQKSAVKKRSKNENVFSVLSM